uniref:G-protein coupled receptors family 1 profile domain-containing protein n=1 Tax=Varanus komodoensis TaxID=61221 RepID=A0A8D2LHL8_VARKO
MHVNLRMNFILPSLPPPLPFQHVDTVHKCSLGPAFIIFDVLMFIICLLGLVGNGIVTRLLGFHIKRNAFTTYILNLTVADFGVLLAIFPIPAYNIVIIFSGDSSFAGQFLLTIISIDRCVSVLFPIWYRCHRPTHWFTTVCAVIWTLSFVICGIHFTLTLTTGFGKAPLMYQFIVNAVVCLPLMTISSLTLFIKVYLISKQKMRGQLLIAILLTLLFFLILAFPLNAFYFTIYLLHNIHPNLVHYGYLCACINSSINPLIYFLVGRQRKGRTQPVILVQRTVYSLMALIERMPMENRARHIQRLHSGPTCNISGHVSFTVKSQETVIHPAFTALLDHIQRRSELFCEDEDRI